MRYCYLVVEGYDDAEFLGRLLRERGLLRIQRLPGPTWFWQPLVPKEYPYRGDLLRRPPVPAFFESTEISVAVSVAESFSKIIAHAEESLKVVRRTAQLDQKEFGTSLTVRDNCG